MPSFHELCRAEPRLACLADHIQSLKPEQGNTSLLWYGNAQVPGIKHALIGLVGFEAANLQLRTSEAYDVAYDHLLSLLEAQQFNPERQWMHREARDLVVRHLTVVKKEGEPEQKYLCS